MRDMIHDDLARKTKLDMVQGAIMEHQAGLTTVIWLLVAWAQFLVVSDASEPNETTSKTAVRASLTFDPNDDLVLIPVRVDSRDYRFLLDTGMANSVFDASLRSHLGPRIDSVRGTTLNGTKMDLESYSPPNALVGSLPLATGPVLCRDLTMFREVSGSQFHGIIGLEFLKSWIITIDFDEGRVDVLSPDTERNPDWGERIPAVYDRRGILFIPATAGKASWSPFMLDTGCNDTGLLDSTLLTRLADAHEVRVFGDDKGVSLSGISSSRIVRLSMLSVGSFRHENLRFVTGTQNVLGLKYLSRYRVTIDIAHECLYLVKGKQFTRPTKGALPGSVSFLGQV